MSVRDAGDPNTFTGAVVTGVVVGLVSGPILGLFHFLAWWLFR